MADPAVPKTALRQRLEDARSFDLERQLRECVEYLENPQILVAEFADSYLTAEAFDNRHEDFCAYGQTQLPKRRWVDRIVQQLIQIEHIAVPIAEPYCFHYLAREIIPLWSSSAVLGAGRDRRAGGMGLDYVGQVEEREVRPVLGVVKPREDETPYISLLRLLTCLAEVSTETQMERANRFLYKGRLPSRPTFDLHLVLVDWSPDERPHALCELSRDLAHQFNVRLKEEWEFPNLLRNIVCATIPERGFDGRYRIEWCV